MKSVKQIVNEFSQTLGGNIPKGIFFVETSSGIDARALIKVFKTLGMDNNNYYLDKSPTDYCIWWRI